MTLSTTITSLLTLSVFTLLTTTATAAVDFSKWQAPGPNDVRSPCPGLNSLANHGILPRNGRGMTVPILVDALHNGMNVDADFAAATGLLSSPTLLSPSFDLNNLDSHNFPIEHDASLSRADAYFGDNHSFNATIFSTVLAYFSSTNTTSIPLAAHARYNRVLTEKARDPAFTYTAQQFITSYGETALYLSVLGDPVTGVAPVEWVKVFFEQERLPYNEGWRPTARQTDLLSLSDMAGRLNGVTGEMLPEGLLVTAQTLGLAFRGLNPVKGVVGNVVAGLL
ncbi:Cloroperoxidase [Saccharata proteae CBS 121410]|uniref:Cloroperoxidase n=1 Tax=Saccharata proteae CBS 121410 TaxID=1314787 RepID=A0A9P4LZM4_9PEZI|nr:Cloroperoxidase [Saccharata proteae CBS 121410]